MSSRPTVFALLLHCGPAHVARFIVSIIVDSVDCVCGRWSWANVGQERWEVVHPSRADFDTPASVVLPVASIWIGAAFLNTLPDHKLRGARRAAFRPAVNGRSLHTRFLTALTRITAAGSRDACLQTVQHVCAAVAAVARALNGVDAPPAGHHSRTWFQNDQTTEALPDTKIRRFNVCH